MQTITINNNYLSDVNFRLQITLSTLNRIKRKASCFLKAARKMSTSIYENNQYK